MPEPFWIDSEYDRANASDGQSRYGAYIRQASFDPWTDDCRHIELAIFAWQQATGPVMAPGYVREHPRVIRAQLDRSDWDGSLLATVDLVTSQPKHLRWMRSDDDRGLWRDWPHEGRSGQERYREPDSDELASSPYLLTTASLRFTVPSGGLPQPHEDGADIETCQQSVAVLVRELNLIVRPVLARIEEN